MKLIFNTASIQSNDEEARTASAQIEITSVSSLDGTLKIGDGATQIILDIAAFAEGDFDVYRVVAKERVHEIRVGGLSED